MDKNRVINLGLHWQFGVVQGGAGPAAVSDLFIKDDSGTGATGDGNSKYTKTIGGSATHNQAVLNPLSVTAGQAITVGLNSGFTGTAASYAWTITELDNGMSVIASVSATSATTADFDSIFTVASGGIGSGMAALYQLTLAVTNAGGTTTKNWNFTIQVA